MDSPPAEVMVHIGEEQSQPTPAPPPRGVTMQEADPLIHPPGRNGLGVIQSSVNTTALPGDSAQKRAHSCLPAPQDSLQATAGPTLVDGSDRCSVAEDSSCVPQTPTSKTRCETPQKQSVPAMSDAAEPPMPCLTSISQNSSPVIPPVNPKPGIGPKKRGRKSKAELMKMKAAQEPAAPLIHPPGRKGLGVIQSPVNTVPLPSDSPQKRGKQDNVEATADPSPMDIVDKSLASEDALPLQTPVKVAKKRGRKSKAELLLMKQSQQLEAQSHVESQQSDSENVEVELTQSGRPRRRAAKSAMKSFQEIANEWAASGLSSPKAEKKVPEETGKKKRRKWKADDSDDDTDFVVTQDVLEQDKELSEDEALSGEESEGDLSLYRTSVFAHGEKFYPSVRGTAENGLHNSIMAPIWSSAQITMDFREAHYSDWEYPEWIPQKNSWRVLSRREAEMYLPQQTTSPPFCIRREGLKEDSNHHQVLGRFQSLPPHPQRFDGTFFVGGPVWSLDWCPTMWGSYSCQYVALYCHPGMDDRHRLGVAHTGRALLQLWRLGALSPDEGVDSAASFSYGLAMDEGCIWDLKFCPSGGWEPPGTSRKGTEMARLGLLAVAFSSGHVEVYSLPHPESLHSHQKGREKDPLEPTIYKVDCVVRLHVGSIKACSPGENGQCFTVAWLPSKPHQYLAAGFYDGTVAIWDLKTRSALQRVRHSGVIKQYPYLLFSAHDNAVRSIEWCKADSNFFVTCGNDRRLKFWDLRRLHAPINNLKRFQSTEITWLLPYCGVAVAQDNCYATHGLCGIHYVDSGFLGYKPYFATPRKGTVWSVSSSDWLSSITSGDITGEVMVVMLPSLNVQSINTKRPLDRRFPVYKVDFQSCAPPSADDPDGGDHAMNGHLDESRDWEHFMPKSFRAATGRFSLLFQDTDMTNFSNMSGREPVKRMQANELKGDLNMERVQLEAIHKVRFNPNLDSHMWIVSGGHSGLVRVHCIRGLMSSVTQKMIQEKRAKFQAMYETAEMVGEAEYSPEVQHCVVEV